ncbi:MAG: hypothetical protein CBC13_11245 [Planctomycetia bacterium TMED53]|nr:MAG: hypothetical protein CBC13_11245 [Planctomycetia bacterium TMED53]
MNTLGICLSAFLLLPLPTEPGDVLPKGYLPAASLLRGWALLSDAPLVYAEDKMGNTPVNLLKPFTLNHQNFQLLEALLNNSGLFLKPVGSADQPRAYWITYNPLADPPRPKPIIEVIQLEHLDPEEAVDLLRSEARSKEKNLDPLDRYSNFVPSPRTNSIVLNCASNARLNHYLRLIREKDQRPPPNQDRPALKIWKAQFMRAPLLAELLEQRWEDRGGQGIHVVVNEPTNSLLIRIPEHLWKEAQKMLQDLDRSRP